MDPDLYDEFGNYVGPELESDESSGEDDEAEEEANGFADPDEDNMDAQVRLEFNRVQFPDRGARLFADRFSPFFQNFEVRAPTTPSDGAGVGIWRRHKTAGGVNFSLFRVL